MFRRRPLLAAAVVGGAAYHIGKKGQQSRDQQAQIDDLEAQQQYQQAPPQYQQAPAPAPSDEDAISQINALKGLLDSGALTQAEFDAQKQKILQRM